MKSFLLSVLFSCLALVFLQAQNFEGIITMTSTEKVDMELVFTIKGKQVLIDADTEDGTVRTLSDRQSETVTTLFEREGKKFGLKMGPETMKMIGQEMADNVDKEGKKWDITVTDDTRMIDGYKCTKVTGQDEENSVVAWITQDLGFTVFDLMPSMMAKAIEEDGGGIQQQIMRQGFLLEGQSTDLKTGEKTKIKLTIKKQKVDNALFDVSSEYKIFDMTDMMSMMMELQNDPEKAKEFEELMKLIQN
jgi:predicted DNA-binding antitoxin AbrB/MazE fold protein